MFGSSNERGTTLYETVIILSALATLSAVTAPVGGSMLERARLVAARQQVETLGTALQLFLADQGGRFPLPEARLLVSEGLAPEAGDGTWTSAPDGRAVLTVGSLLYSEPVTPLEQSPVPGYGWKGPYVQGSVQADPWGNRYSVALRRDGARIDRVIVLSAGPDGRVDLGFGELPAAGRRAESADITFVVAH